MLYVRVQATDTPSVAHQHQNMMHPAANTHESTHKHAVCECVILHSVKLRNVNRSLFVRGRLVLDYHTILCGGFVFPSRSSFRLKILKLHIDIVRYLFSATPAIGLVKTGVIISFFSLCRMSYYPGRNNPFKKFPRRGSPDDIPASLLIFVFPVGPAGMVNIFHAG